MIVDLMAAMLECQMAKVMQMEELELMEYLRRGLMAESLQKCSLEQLLKKSPRVKLT